MLPRSFCRNTRFTMLAAGVVAMGCWSLQALADGADITHSDLQDASHYGPVGGIHAYAWGSNTCNIGDISLSWINGGTPALAMNAYRLYDGRLIQIGLGNCKTACCVANGNGCGLTCMSSGFGLRPGCRDVYSSGFNGGQGRLGPRSIINPFSGAFQGIPAGSGDAIWRRCQVREADMSATTYPGARYFAEGVYVCTEEDHEAQLNNATYRMMNVANTGATPNYAWTVTDSSRVGRPAIYAWRDHGLGLNMPDTSVQVVMGDVPGEGRFFAAGKVTTLPGNLWRYDYAVYNLNSHVSAGVLQVILPEGSTATNAGFNAPFYHSGEVYDNTTWSFSRGPNYVSWSSPATFDQAPNTNALRWGTMYNFWFTSNNPPAAGTGSVTLGLFRPYTFNGETIRSIEIGGLPVPALPCTSPQVGVQPTPQVTCPGGTAVLSAAAAPNSSTTTSYRWRRADAGAPGGFLVLSDGASPWGGGSQISGSQTSTLTIQGVTPADAGANGFSVTITNECGSVNSNAASVIFCRGDYNCSAAVSVQDVFDFVGDYFAGNPKADVNGVDGITTQDIFDFVGHFFTPC